MSDLLKSVNYPIITGKSGVASTSAVHRQTTPSNGSSFEEMLQKSIEQAQPHKTLTFSKHAMARTEQRGISLSEQDIDRLSHAIGKASDKGVTDTLVLMNNTAFIVNVPNRVVVTVVDNQEAEQTIFTNIDGAVIL